MAFFKTIVATLAFFSLSIHAADYKAPRGPGGVHPDLNGIWQALNTANYDIEMHTASHSMQLREGPHGPLPAVKTLYLGAVEPCLLVWALLKVGRFLIGQKLWRKNKRTKPIGLIGIQR